MSNAIFHKLIDDKTKQILDEIEFVRLPEVRSLTGLSTSTIYRMSASGTFPKQVKLGAKAVAWIKSEVQRWGREQVNRSRGHDLPAASDDQQPMSNQG